MALEPIALKALLMEVVKGDPLRVLSLGYPDVLYAGTGFKDIPDHPEAAEIKAWHKFPGRVLDTAALFKSLNISATYLDITKARGPEILSDLNTDGFEGEQFDVVIDPGTTEHVLNIGNALKLIVDACKVGGVVIHTNPCNMPNHGFWSFNPTLYIDWYGANGFMVETLTELTGPVHARSAREANTLQRFEALPNSTLLCVARKMKARQIAYPIQSKYRAHPTLKGAA